MDLPDDGGRGMGSRRAVPRAGWPRPAGVLVAASPSGRRDGAIGSIADVNPRSEISPPWTAWALGRSAALAAGGQTRRDPGRGRREGSPGRGPAAGRTAGEGRTAAAT